VIVNLVNNAVKYAPDSKEIHLNICRDGNYVKISVKDAGPGIPDDHLPHLFNRYWRADHSGVKYTGLGLGLFICSEIIKRHDGHIGAESELGNGSTFWFKLPIG
ncbi:MAG: ATP-binding protein, partial [Chryseobacterium sp.]